jgi:hypothetical protein
VEDNHLIDLPYLSGPGEWGDVAVDRQQEHYGKHPHDTDRHWILEGFEAMSAASPVVAGLFDKAHNPMHRITPSAQAAKALVQFWRRKGEDGQIVHDFTSDTWDTRFLGDLYQYLSEAARKTYALLQTPAFVEEFILDLTLTPALDEFGLEPDYPLWKERPDFEGRNRKGLRLIDPTCGSGHFLLGAFHRLLEQWEAYAPGEDRWELIRRTLYSVHGVDKNPFAVAIARFRLLVAALKAAGTTSLTGVEFDINVAVGDSLLHGRLGNQTQRTLFSGDKFVYVTEDINEDRFQRVDLLGVGSYHVVVGNPPYITVKDKQENENYRTAFPMVCKGQYALSVPFAQRFFQLGVNGHHTRAGAGYIGQITANSFMKREFGSKLIEEYFNQRVDLTHVIDTSGAYIPGHSTPTVILIGRRSAPRGQEIRVVQGIQGEPTQPEDPAKGLVWTAITDQVARPGSESQWVDCAELPRGRLAKHPWSLSGGGAEDLKSRIDRAGTSLESRIKSVGRTTVAGEDDAWLLPDTATVNRLRETEFTSPFVVGENVRDFTIGSFGFVRNPYTNAQQTNFVSQGHPLVRKIMWASRTILRNRMAFEKTLDQRGLPWYSHLENYSERLKIPLSIAFAEIATHNHFALDRGGKLFKQTAPVIKLPEGATEDEHLEVLGLLNSSIICFWLKQVSFNKGNATASSGMADQPWSWNYQFGASKVSGIPLPTKLPLDLGRLLDSLAAELTKTEPASATAKAIPSRKSLDDARAANLSVRRRLVALQEELDWQVYGLYGLLNEPEVAALTGKVDQVPEVEPGQRAFEIVLARRMISDEISTKWFSHHDLTPTTEIPSCWPPAYRELVQRRIDCIQSRRDIALIERPEHKRRWYTTSWEKREKEALSAWLLDACERRELWFTEDHNGIEQPQLQTINRLADRLRANSDVVQVAALLDGADTDLAKVLSGAIRTEHVPYLAAMRYKDSGLRKRKQWEETWTLQREEDRTGENFDIAVPPKYTSGDFLKAEYWRQRGKLDVPKERFISYPGASPESDDSLLIGWAGWDHREQAHALTMLALTRIEEDNWTAEQITPLLAGLDEQLFWVEQWHSEVDPSTGESPAQTYSDFLNDMMRQFELNRDDLKAWRPAAKTRRKAKNQ